LERSVHVVLLSLEVNCVCLQRCVTTYSVSWATEQHSHEPCRLSASEAGMWRGWDAVNAHHSQPTTLTSGRNAKPTTY